MSSLRTTTCDALIVPSDIADMYLIPLNWYNCILNLYIVTLLLHWSITQNWQILCKQSFINLLKMTSSWNIWNIIYDTQSTWVGNIGSRIQFHQNMHQINNSIKYTPHYKELLRQQTKINSISPQARHLVHYCVGSCSMGVWNLKSSGKSLWAWGYMSLYAWRMVTSATPAMSPISVDKCGGVVTASAHSWHNISILEAMYWRVLFQSFEKVCIIEYWYLNETENENTFTEIGRPIYTGFGNYDGSVRKGK